MILRNAPADVCAELQREQDEYYRRVAEFGKSIECYVETLSQDTLTDRESRQVVRVRRPPSEHCKQPSLLTVARWFTIALHR